MGAIWGDIPSESYERPGKFLTKDERGLYLDKEHNAEGVIDAWWTADRKGDYNYFIDVIKITEPRFLKQDNLFANVEKSEDVKTSSLC
ncbi:MAG: hypothetical protein IPP73_11560 [Chitinophagaceae bacterium]|nr:hypothetical protein [Chitinophagaceae bacterium]